MLYFSLIPHPLHIINSVNCGLIQIQIYDVSNRSQLRIYQMMKYLTWNSTVNYMHCLEEQKLCSILLRSRLLLD